MQKDISSAFQSFSVCLGDIVFLVYHFATFSLFFPTFFIITPVLWQSVISTTSRIHHATNNVIIASPGA